MLPLSSLSCSSLTWSYLPVVGKRRGKKGVHRPTTYSVRITPFFSVIPTTKNWAFVNMPFPNCLLYVVIAWAIAETRYESALQVSTTVSCALVVSFPTAGSEVVAVEHKGCSWGGGSSERAWV